MIANTLWNALRARLQTARRPASPIALQTVLPTDADLAAVQALLDQVGLALDVQFELKPNSGDIVLMDVDLAARMSPQLVQAFAEERPLVTLTGLHRPDEMLMPPAARLESRQRELLGQLREIPLVRRRAGSAIAETTPTVPQGSLSSGFDSQFDSNFDITGLLAAEFAEGQRQVVQRVLDGLRAREAAVLCASYGPGANIRFNFNTRLVAIDSLALQQLRVRRELPQPAPGATTQPDAPLRDLEETVWDLGLAAGPFPLLDEPADWWHQPLAWTAGARIEPYTRVPRYIELARLLQAGPVTPSQLRRRARVGVSDLRRFLQAALMLSLLHWQPQGHAVS
jgi:hypothetical protein